MYFSSLYLFTSCLCPRQNNYLRIRLAFYDTANPCRQQVTNLKWCTVLVLLSNVTICFVIGCPLNYFGPTCSQSCPAQCNNSNCHIDSGECFGCKDGYRGPKCREGMRCCKIKLFMQYGTDIVSLLTSDCLLNTVN